MHQFWQPPWPFSALVATVSVDALDEWEAMAGLPGYGNGTVSVLNIGGMNNDAQQEAEGVDQNMAFASCDLLARVVTRGVERRPLLPLPWRSERR